LTITQKKKVPAARALGRRPPAETGRRNRVRREKGNPKELIVKCFRENRVRDIWGSYEKNRSRHVLTIYDGNGMIVVELRKGTAPEATRGKADLYLGFSETSRRRNLAFEKGGEEPKRICCVERKDLR